MRIGPERSSSTVSREESGTSASSATSSRTQRQGDATSGLRQEAAAQAALEPVHLAVVGLVVVPEAVQDAVQQQQAQLALAAVTELGGLAQGLRHRDHHVAQVPTLGRGAAREGEHVGGRVLAAE